MTTILHHLIQSIRDAAVYNPEVQVAPACILWPDKDRQWQSIIPRLQLEMPELLVLSDYDPQREAPGQGLFQLVECDCGLSRLSAYRSSTICSYQ